jgi:RimJ/RimL family protein N-acetyltransferase
MLVGKRVCLRPIEREDLERFVRFFADPEVRANLDMVLGLSNAQEIAWFEEQLRQPPLEQPFAVDLVQGTERPRLIGGAGLRAFDWRNRSAELGLVIGDKSMWGQGLGTEITRLLLRHAFFTLNLHRVWLRVFADHARAQKVYEKVGFTLEGRQRDGDFRNGRYRDVLVYSLLAREWRQRVGEPEPPAPPTQPQG